MDKINCWEALECGFEPGGKNVNEFGICPAASNIKYHEINNGKNGGRFCWAIDKTFCKEGNKGNFDDKFINCLNCSFFKMVNKEESRKFILTPTEVKDKI